MRVSLNRPAMAFQRSSARVSAGAPPVLALRGSSGSGEHSTLRGEAQCARRARLWMKITLFCRYFASSTLLSTGVEDGDCVASEDNARLPGAAVSIAGRVGRTVENLAPGAVVYTRDSSPPRLKRRRETHLSAERSPQEAASRVPSADVLPRGPRDPQAAARERAQAPLCLRRPQCNAATGSPGRKTSTPCTAGAARPRAATSCCTGSRVRTIPTASLDSASRCRVPSGRAVARNRVKRLLRESWRELLPTVPGGQDYVLAARPGLAEPVETRGKEWLVARDHRRPREGARMKYLGIGLVHAVALDVRAPHASGHVQVPPDLLAVRTGRVPGVRLRTGMRLVGVEAPPL